MTTAHEGESPDEAAFFFMVNTCFDNHDFRRYLILFVGADDAARRAVSERVTHYAKPTHLHDEPG